ncbi:MAG: tetratricopeptide repeat protein [Pirellulales bacterium]|nr:tetratricopeptide repeat protein [Pirellulales bacterium]
MSRAVLLRALVVGLFLLGLARPISAESPSADVPLVDEAIRQAFQDRNFAAALEALDKAIQAKDAPKDYLTYLKGRALSFQEKYDDAVAVFDQFAKQFPDSPWARRARFAAAVALARKGDFRSAETIYRAEAEQLLSADRKQELAEGLIEFAEICFKPPKADEKPNYEKARVFYQKALEIGLKPQKRIEVELRIAECHQNLEQYEEAVGLLRKFVEEHPDAPEAIEAQYRLGECLLKQDKPAEARRAWQDLLGATALGHGLAAVPATVTEGLPQGSNDRTDQRSKPSEPRWGDLRAGQRAGSGDPRPAANDSRPAREPRWGDLRAGQRAGSGDPRPALVDPRPAPSPRIAEAQFQLSRTWKIPEPETEEALSLGVAALEAFLERFPTHKLAGQSHLDIAKSYLHRGRHQDAAARLQALLADQRYQLCEEIPQARNLLGRAFLLQKQFDQALAVWRDYLAKHPSDAAWSEVQQQVVDTEYLRGIERYRAKDYPAARQEFEQFLAGHPLDARNPDVLFLFGRMDYDQEKWDEAIADWRRVVSKYPETEASSRAQYMIGLSLERHLGKLGEALEEYRKLTWGKYTAEAEQAIARLTARRMTVVTERVFRSDETPRLKLSTRNIPSVTVRAYKVDLETYFRKMHLAGDVEKLDITLIDPDATFEFKVPGYAEYQEFESQVEAPLPGGAHAGVMAVTFSSETLEATTLVIQSNLDVIVKSSRDEVFVFAQNMLTGKPWPGAKLLISNGSQVFAEAATGKDGVFQAAYAELAQAGDVRVMAVAEGNVASNVVGLEGVGLSKGLTDKGYIYTDRPAYRAGQEVHVRGCIRRVANDAYVVEKGKKYVLEVLDPRGRVVRQDEVVLGDFGTLAASFALPPTSPQGTYRVLVREEKQSYQGTFEVHEYKLEPVRLAIDVPRRVYCRGEEIEGVIRVEYYYGAPLAGREIVYRLADQELHTAATDAKGEVHFKLPTREFAENAEVDLTASLAERNLRAEARLFIAPREFQIELTTVRDVFVAGEPFEVTVRTRDLADQPTGRKLKLAMLEVTSVEGKVGERLVEEREVETAADGAARLTIKLENGGRYRLRAEGTDRFHNPVSGEAGIVVSGEKDDVRLRILADRHTFKAGDTAEITLHWREPPALALVTLQGARVLDYRLVELQTGPNKLPVAMDSRLAPNFELAVVVMRDVRGPAKAETPKESGGTGDAWPRAAKPVVRLHEASSPFIVERELNVAVSARRKGGDGPLRPGEEAEVTVLATDPQGKPAAAELSLALVEQALLDRFAWPMPPIQEFFRGSDREPAIRTTSSITFAYRPDTRPINPRLLSEQQRAELAREEAESQKLAVAGMGEMGGVAISMDSPRAFSGDLDIPFLRDRNPAGLNENGTADFDSRIDLITESIAYSGKPAESGVQPSIAPPAVSEKLGEEPSLDGNMAKRPEPPKATQPASAGEPISGETAYWNPSVLTNAEGKATLTIRIPERTTAWSLVARGITADTLAGEAVSRVVARKDLFGQMKLPAAFTEGDKADVLVSVHNDAVAQGTIDVVLKTTIDGRSVEEKKTLEVKSKGIHELPFAVALVRPEQPADKNAPAPTVADVHFELSVTAGQQRDVVRETVPLKPYGMTVYATAGGSAESDTTVWVETTKDMPVASPSLQILVGPTVERSLMDVVFAPAPFCQSQSLWISSHEETTTSDLMASLGLQQLLGLGRDSGPEALALDQRIRSAVGMLVSSQKDDGGWGWTCSGQKSDRYMSARAVWALGLARRSGYIVPEENYEKALGYLAAETAAAGNGDYETKAVLLHALCVAGRGDFALANRLHRERPSLSSAAMLYLSLAFLQMDRRQIAAELLELLARRDLDQESSRRTNETGSLPWNHSPVELRALYALAIQAVNPQSPKSKELIDWLMAHRTGHRWSPDKATGPAALALCHWFAASRFAGERYRLIVWVNDRQAVDLEMDQAKPTHVIDVPGSLLVAGRQRILLQLTGRGRYTYQAILGGFVPADKLRSTTTDWRVDRTYEPAPLVRDGKEIPRGFDILAGSYQRYRNTMTQLPVGERGLVRLVISRNSLSDTPAEHLEYLAVTEPVPAGAAVAEGSIQGNVEHYEIQPGAITFYLSKHRSTSTVDYQLYGYLPGTYAVAPTVVRNVHRPEQIAVAPPKALTVLPAGAKSSDPYRLTPQELFALGKLAFERNDLAAAQGHLTELITKWNVNRDVYKPAVTMLLDAHLTLGPAAKIVHYFEVVKERWPDEQIPFAKIMKVAAAYHEIGEYERSFLVFRATVESNFTLESGVAGFLSSQGEFLKSVAVMARLLREYPPESYVAAADYALAQEVYSKAPAAGSDPKLREAKLNRVDLVARAWRMLESFLTAYPEDPAADQASFSAANALLELEKFSDAEAACRRYADRYPKSELAGSFWYIIGYCRFATGRHEQAIEVLRKVAQFQAGDGGLRLKPSESNKWLAIYILGQIYHSLGQPAQAVEEYRRIEDRFPDAKQSIDYFLRKAIQVPEVTTVRPGEKVQVELAFRNVAACDVKVYRIDLMKFALIRQNLAGIAEINLAGIRPHHEATVELGDGKDYRDRTKKLALPLADEGAYLVVCRGENLYASGLVLLTPLEMEVQHDPAARQVRATVKDAATAKYLDGVEVKITGSGNSDFISGKTDRRGLFVAEGVVGPPTVIAQAAAGRYAFHRSQAEPGKPPIDVIAQAPIKSPMPVLPLPPAGQASWTTVGVPIGGPGSTEAAKRIEAALDATTRLDLKEVALEEVARLIEQQHRIPIQLDRKALEDVGIPTDTPITFRGAGMKLRSALGLILRDLELTYLVQDEFLLITTRERAESELTTVAYLVSDLVRFRDSQGKPWADFDTLIETITTTVMPTTWDEVGGPGSIAPMEYPNADVIVLSQTQETHREVASLLQKLRMIAGLKPSDGQLPVKERPAESAAGAMPMGGMGGFGAGMGAAAAAMPTAEAPAPAPGNELLRGLQETNQSLQSGQIEQLQDMYHRGMGGMGGSVGAGKAF